MGDAQCNQSASGPCVDLSHGADLVITLDGRLNVLWFGKSVVDQLGVKVQALLLLLAVTPDLQLPRRTIERKLWSVRAPEQAGGSLRQALARLRKCLRENHCRDAKTVDVGVLGSNRQTVWLDASRTSISCNNTNAENIAEDLITRDPAFDQWLEDFRTQRAAENNIGLGGVNDRLLLSSSNPASISADSNVIDFQQASNRFVRPALQITPLQNGDPIAHAFADLANHQVAQNLSDALSVDLCIGGGKETFYTQKNAVLSLQTYAVVQGSKALLSMKLVDLSQSRLVLARQVQVPSNLNHLLSENHLYRLAHEVAEQALEVIQQPVVMSQERNVLGLYRRAMCELFSFNGARLQVSDQMLDTIYRSYPEPAILAWRAFLRMVMFVEQTETDPRELFSEAEEFMMDAIEQGSGNASVLGILAHMHPYPQPDLDAASRLASDAVKLNPGCAMAHCALATVRRLSGDNAVSLQHATKGLDIVSASPHRHWWYMTACLSHLACGNFDQALTHAKSASTYAPHFRPPLRYLYALYLKRGDADLAKSALMRLRMVEPDFSLQMVREKTDYPVGLLESSGLLELSDLPDL